VVIGTWTLANGFNLSVLASSENAASGAKRFCKTVIVFDSSRSVTSAASVVFAM
jgi:hypothetical protein